MPPEVSIRPPRLGISHLMLWTLLSACYLTFVRVIMATQRDLPEVYATLQWTASVFQCAITGAVLTGAIVLTAARIRWGPPLLAQPGHWLLIVSAVLILIQLPVSLFIALLNQLDLAIEIFLIVTAAIYLGPAWVYGLASRQTETYRWKLCFVALSVLSVLQALQYLGFGLQMFRITSLATLLTAIPAWGNLAVSGLLVGVSVRDVVVGQRRDWLHWTGVATFTATTCISLLWMVGPWLLQR